MGNNGNSIIATIADGLTISTLECLKGFSCSATTLNPGWTLVAFAGHNGTGQVFFTITSADNHTIVTTYDPSVPDVDSKIDGTGDTNKGTDLISSAYIFQLVALNGSAIDCPKTPCKLKINYK